MNTDEVWEQYARTRSIALRDRLLVEYLPLSKRVAASVWKNFPDHVELDDVRSYAVMGLLKAIENFDPSRKQVPFETYAAVTIRGGIIDELRSIDWAPRSVRRRQREVERARTDLESVLGRSPTVGEIAAQLDWTPDDVESAIQATEVTRFKSLDEASEPDEEGRPGKHLEVAPGQEPPDPEERASRQVTYDTIAGYIYRFPAQEQLLIVLYYHEHLTLAEVGKVLGIPETRASQIHARTMLQMRDTMEEALAS